MKQRSNQRKKYPHQPNGAAFLCLRGPVLVALVVWWNAMFLLAIWFNGGLGRIRDESAALTTIICVSSVSIFMWLVALNESFAEAVIAQARAAQFHRPTFVFTGIILALLACGFSLSLISMMLDSQ